MLPVLTRVRSSPTSTRLGRGASITWHKFGCDDVNWRSNNSLPVRLTVGTSPTCSRGVRKFVFFLFFCSVCSKLLLSDCTTNQWSSSYNRVKKLGSQPLHHRWLLLLPAALMRWSSINMKWYIENFMEKVKRSVSLTINGSRMAEEL